MATMGDDSLILREDGYLRVDFETSSIIYHSNLNIILLKTLSGEVHVLDVNSGVILQSSRLSSDDGVRGLDYVPGADRVFFWDDKGVGARTDYNGVLLLHTALQQPVSSAQADDIIKIELVLSEAVLLYQCLQSIDILSVEGLSEVIRELKNVIDADPVKKGVKAIKWSTVCLQLPQSVIRLVANGVVTELRNQSRGIPALAIAAAVSQRANDLVPGSKGKESRAWMFSEAARKDTFKRWPHMDYKWALPAQMAQAGFYHQPSSNGDDRAMCFTCLVCLVCWEKSDEPWVEHERHSPSCPFVRGEYTHNVPISVANATSCAVMNPCVSVVSKGNTGDLVATGTSDGRINVWKFDCGLKQSKYINISPYDSIFSGILASDSNKVWTDSLEKDCHTYGLCLTAMAFIGLTSEDTFSQNQGAEACDKDSCTNKSKPQPSLVCAVTITRTNNSISNQSIEEDSSEKALFNSGSVGQSNESIKAMNDQNEAKSNSVLSSKLLFLLTYEMQGTVPPCNTTVVQANNSGNSKPGGSKKVSCAVSRPDDSNIYDEIYLHYSDEDTELPQCTNNLLDEHINVINLNASSSKEDAKIWEPKKIIFTKHFKVIPNSNASPKFPMMNAPQIPNALLPELPESGQGSMQDFVGKMTALKSWTSGNLDCVGTKLADQTDAGVLQQADPITHYLNMNGPLQISDLKWYEGDSDKVKVTYGGGGKNGTQATVNNGNNDGFDSDPAPDEVIPSCIAIQCLSLPNKLSLRDDTRVTHLIPTDDKNHLIVILSSLEQDSAPENRASNDKDRDMDVDNIFIANEKQDKSKEVPVKPSEPNDGNAYMLLYRMNGDSSTYVLNDSPVSVKELTPGETPVDVCLIPSIKNEVALFAVVGQDGSLRLYDLPDFNVIATKSVPQGAFVSVTYCTSVERLSICTKNGTLYFFALNDGDGDSSGDIDDDEFSNLDLDMLQKASVPDAGAGIPPVVAPPPLLANKPELQQADLENLISLTGLYGTNTAVPYTAVVPGFWCELSPAQRPRSDHQNNRTWRLQNTSSTWDEHVLELTLPYSAPLAHVELGFNLHTPCTTPPIIQVTLLKQNIHGIGYKKDASYCPRADTPIYFSLIDADMSNLVENPVNSVEYLRAHNAEILAGPLLLASGLDLSQQSGTLTLTSPRLYRAKGRTFLIHIKTLFDPAKDMGKVTSKSSEGGAKKAEFIGCDWLHQISITVRSSPHTEVPQERQQRIAMLESNNFLNTLFDISINARGEDRKLALDLLIWVISIRLQRIRMAKTDKLGVAKDSDKDVVGPIEAQQVECIKIVEKNIEALIKNCILCAKRSIAKKSVKIILVTSEGVKNLPKPWNFTFEQTLLASVISCIPLLGACDSPGSMRWLASLAMHAATPDTVPSIAAQGLSLLEQLARCIEGRSNVFHSLLRARLGLYGLPLERSIFDMEGPVLGKSTSTPVTYASVLAGDTTAANITAPKPDYQLKDLCNMAGDTVHTCAEGKATPSGMAWWNQNNSVSVFGAGLCESMPLHVSCHSASDGTKLEQTGGRLPVPAVSSLPGDPTQLWNTVKENQLKQAQSQESDSLEDGENSSLMECDPQEKVDQPEERFFNELDTCGIPWQQLVTKPPQHTLVVERMHSGARRFIVLDFGHPVRLTDVIIPSCTDLVTLSVDIWLLSEERDCTKLAFATDIASKNLLLTDIQPPPLCRFVKITTIGRYGMSAMKCKIPLGWFYGEIAEIANVQASLNALCVLHQDLTCRFRLATGKLMDLLKPYLDLYNGNAAHMMAYLNMANEADPRVLAAYQECIELQQQLHTVSNILDNLENCSECDEEALELVNQGQSSSEALLQRSSTDKLRVMAESIVDMLLYFYFQLSEGVRCEEVSASWCQHTSSLLCRVAPRPAAALATLLARLCGGASWWGPHLAETLKQAFAPVDAPPLALDRCLVLVMYMARKSLGARAEGGVAEALAEFALRLLQMPRAEPALTHAILVALASVLDSAHHSGGWARWDFVTGGRPGGAPETMSPISRNMADCKLHRRKLQKKLIHHMQELEAARRGSHATQEEQKERARITLKAARMAMLGKRAGGGSPPGPKPDSESSSPDVRPPRLVSPALAKELAQALVNHILAMDNTTNADVLVLCAKVVGRLCAGAGGAGLVEASCLLGLARLAATLPPWPRHALTALLQDLVEYENSDNTTSESASGWGPSSAGAMSRVIRVSQDDNIVFGKNIRSNKPKVIAVTGNGNTIEYQLPLVIESDDSEPDEKLDQYYLDAVKKASNPKSNDTLTISNISACVDARLESGTEACGEAASRRLLLTGASALAAAVRAPPVYAPRTPDDTPPARAHPPLTHSLYEVFRRLASEFQEQDDCTFVENVLSLWLTLNGSTWGTGGLWGACSLATPSDGPKIRLSSDTVNALLATLVQLENISLRCWVLSIQALAWVSNLPLQTEGSTQTMGRVILECEHFVPAIVKFVNLNVATDGAVAGSDSYLGGASAGAGAAAANALQTLLTRVLSGRGAAGACAALRCVCGVWRRDAGAGTAYDLQASLLRAAYTLAPMLTSRHAQHAVSLMDTVAYLSSEWMAWSAEGRTGTEAGGTSGSEATLSGLLADVLAGGASAAPGRRAPLRRSVLAQLLQLCRRLLSISLATPAQSLASPASPVPSEESQTDESKATQQQQEGANLEDERKQPPRTPCLADTVLQHRPTMQRLFKTLSLCEGTNWNCGVLNSGNSLDPTPNERSSVRDEVFCLVLYLAELATHPSLIINSLLEFLRKKQNLDLSPVLKQFIMDTLEKPEALATFVELGGLEVVVDKLVGCHRTQLNSRPGLVSSLMNYLKLPPQLINLSTSAANNNKKTPLAIVETSNGLVNFAPLCTVSCGNPTAQAADVLLGGTGANGGTGACAARRVRAAAWSYHFFSADDASLPLTLNLPYAIQLHEVQLQPHLTSLATCPGAVAVEAGCSGTLAPLGPPQNTAGMTYIRLALSRPIVASTVQVRLYKPRDSSNMGLLQLRVLGTAAFSKTTPALSTYVNSCNSWASLVATCTRSRMPVERWACVTSPGALDALTALLSGSGVLQHAHAALLAAARACPDVREPLVARLLRMDAHAHAQAFQVSVGGESSSNMTMNAICELLYQLCAGASECSAQTYLAWLASSAAAWLRDRQPASPAYVQTLASVLWTLKESGSLENLEMLITDELFDIVFTWVRQVPEDSLLKKALDAVLCSMCYIRLPLFKGILQQMELISSSSEQESTSDSMEGLTDDKKVSSGVGNCPRSVLRLSGSQLGTVAAAAMSPQATIALLHSELPRAVVHAISQFSLSKLQFLKDLAAAMQDDSQMTDSDKAKDQCNSIEATEEEVVPLSMVGVLVDWVRSLCTDRRLKDWLGGPGNGFWRPLLHLLCRPRPTYGSWQESEEFAQLEEKTIQLFAELTTCHPSNQRLFASTLHSILESLQYTGSEGISGFTRALILRLLLSSERALVALRWASRTPGGEATPGRHPAAHGHSLLALPLHTTIRTLLRDHRPPVPLDRANNTFTTNTAAASSTGQSVQRSASDTAILTTVEAWELSVAAASSAKDKRAKDAKNTNLKQLNTKIRRHCKAANNASDQSVADDMIESSVRVQVAGIEGFLSPNVTLGQLSAIVPHVFGPHLTLTLHIATKVDAAPTWEGGVSTAEGNTSGPEGGGAVLREFGLCGGLALVAAQLPHPQPATAPPPRHVAPHQDLDWVKLDDTYDEVVELGLSTGAVVEETNCMGVPPHALIALGILLKLPGYAEALLNEGPRAVHLLRLLLGVTDDEDGRMIVVGSGGGNPGWSLGTLPFRVVSSLLEAAPRSTDDGRLLRRLLLCVGAVRLLLACLAVFTHHQAETPHEQSQGSNGSSSRSKSDDKNQLYWAKGTGFGTGSTQQSWNVEQALVRQRTEEEHVTVLLQVLASYMNPGEQWPPEEGSGSEAEPEPQELPAEFVELVGVSALVPAICSYLRNDSVLDMSRHIPLYVCVLRCARALWTLRSRPLAPALRPLPRLLRQMSRTTNSYASKLKMNKKNLHGKMTYSQRFSTSSGSELSEEDEGLATLIMDIQATAALMCRWESEEEALAGGIARPVPGATREARYIEVMRRLQFETFEMIEECPENGYKFTVSYHFEGTVRAAGERSHPARMKRLAQEAATLNTSLPLSYSSSVFVRTDTDRLDVMKVLITGPSDTPYANGCFVLDVYFPADYPAVPMLINLETTGRHSVRFNPNLYNDGKVCLSVLNTWHGRPEEKWNAHTSSFLQVLVSIQSLILVPEPYFNEPGYERSRGTRVGTNASLEYNSNIYQACVRWAMLDHLRNPTPCFKQVIQTHFWIKRNEIMETVAGWITELEGQVGDKRTQRSISLNLMALKRHYLKIQEELAKLGMPPGLDDLDEPFTLPAAPAPVSPAPPSPAPAPTTPLADDMDQDMEKLVSQVLD